MNYEVSALPAFPRAQMVILVLNGLRVDDVGMLTVKKPRALGPTIAAYVGLARV